ncbi:MAG: peptidoglycan binding domain-containing protein, partial [Patescibacteria group bacterium]
MDNNKISRNIYMGNVNLSRLNKSEAENILKPYSESLLNTSLKIIVGDSIRSTTLESIGTKINLPETINLAYDIGRSGPWYKKAYEKFKLFFVKKNLNFKYSINKDTLNQKMLEYFPTLERPAQNATLIYDAQKNSFVPQKESVGHVLDKQPII